MRKSIRASLLVAAGLALSWIAPAQTPSQPAPAGDRVARFPAMSREAEAKGLAEPFKGITTNGETLKGLFPVRSTGVSTEPVRVAAEKFLAALSEEQRRRTQFPVDDLEWRKWMNQSFYVRQGTGFKDMTQAQREAAFGLMRASLSAKGMKLSRDIMKLNHTLGELNHDNFVEYGEWLYWITVMGTPSASEPWGWQLDGHHLIVNYFVLGDQVVMTPSFWGSEPTYAEGGKYRGTRVMKDEQDAGLAFMKSLTPEQRKLATLRGDKPGNDNLTEAFKDNVVLDYAGVPVRTLSESQKRQLLSLIGLYVHNLRDDHARVEIDQVDARMNDTYFAWIGGTEASSVFYYRIHSPVILIEFDHQKPANLRHLYADVPYREHVHAVVRTPNGNDYGKDLLRQHYAEHPH
ncbi:MAG TPA: DUF3500 domain-containing protein [Steroidobacteraceae bacterium]|nr:DUF3500 domain-containing protein [Steroidobacteraceae bacterium]